jgi:hypothetical protein
MPEAEQHADHEDERYASLPVHEPFEPNIDFRHALLVLLLRGLLGQSQPANRPGHLLHGLALVARLARKGNVAQGSPVTATARRIQSQRRLLITH